MDKEIKEEVILPENPKDLKSRGPAARWAGEFERVMDSRPKPFEGVHGKAEVTEKGGINLQGLKFVGAEEIPAFMEWIRNTFGIE